MNIVVGDFGAISPLVNVNAVAYEIRLSVAIDAHTDVYAADSRAYVEDGTTEMVIV